MLKHDLTAARLRELLHYDQLTGLFTWLVKTNKSRNWVGKQAGCPDKNTGYIMIGIDGQHIRAHRLAWLYVTGSFPTREIDHKNRVKSDNRWKNLRAATPQMNAENRMAANRNNLSGLLGVATVPEGFMARIKINGRHRYLGTFATAEQAHSAYVIAKRKLHAGCIS